MQPQTARQTLQGLNVAACSLLIGLLGMPLMIPSAPQVSAEEKRELSTFPVFSWGEVLKGRFARGIDDYISDNLGFRHLMVEWSASLSGLRGIASDDIETYEGHAKPSSPPTAKLAQSRRARAPTSGAGIAPSSPATATVEANPPLDLALQAPVEEANPDQDQMLAASTGGGDPYENIESIIIYRGRAVQRLGGTPEMARAMADAINRYARSLPGVRVYFMGLPIGSDFYLPPQISHGVAREKNALAKMHELLDPSVAKVDAYSEIATHKDEYVYFRTDHHWTARGAYYAYTAFSREAQLEALPLEAMSEGRITGFLGTLYYRTLSPTLRKSIDTAEYFKVPGTFDVRIFPGDGGPTRKGLLYAESARGPFAYGVFLGGDYPLMRVTTALRNGRSIVVVKDSYGNALVPYLAAHYENIFVVDYRYFKGDLGRLIAENHVGELVFAHNTFVFLSRYAAQRATAFLPRGGARVDN